jgi:DNA-binding response OmpR family regulator
MAKGHPPIILVVDHERDRREALEALLTKAGHRVLVAEDGNQALKIADDVQPALALIGIALPGLGSYALAQGLRRIAEDRTMHLIAITPQRVDRERVLSSGFNMHIPTPIDPGSLLGVIADLLGVRPDESAVA